MRIVMVGSVIAGLVASSGCGGDDGVDPPPPPVDAGVVDAGADPNEGAISGTRIRTRWYQTDDGLRSFRELVDSTTGLSCSPQEFADGTFYCAPQVGVVRYLDDACTQPVGFASTVNTCVGGPPAEDFFAEREPGPCNGAGPITRVFRRGAPMAITHFRIKTATGCSDERDAPDDVEVFALGEQLPTSSLVAMTRSTPNAQGGRIGRRSWTTEDGLRLPAEPYDAEIAGECTVTPSLTDPAQATCIPSRRSEALYSDDMCSTPVATVPKDCPATAIIDAVAQPSCAVSTHRYFRPGPKATVSSLYSLLATCESEQISTAADYHEAGTEVTLPVLARARGNTGHRIEPMYARLGAFEVRSGLFDTMLGIECDITTDTTTSVISCLPRARVSSRFSDPDCTVPVDVVVVDPRGATCPALLKPSHALKQLPTVAGQCTGGFEAHTVAGLHTGTTYFKLMSGVCTAFDDTLLEVYDTGPAVPLSSFATFTVLTDGPSAAAVRR